MFIICYIYNNVEKKVVVIDENDWEIGIDDVILVIFEKYIVFKKSVLNYKRVNIYWLLFMFKVKIIYYIIIIFLI